MLQEVFSHHAWNNELSLSEVEAHLRTSVSVSYTLIQGMDKHHFILSFISSEGKIVHKNIRLLNVEGDWKYKNGCEIYFCHLSDLVNHYLTKFILAELATA